jgi:transposase-like protein
LLFVQRQYAGTDFTAPRDAGMFPFCSSAAESFPAPQEGDMARIKQADHPTILRMVDAERRKVADVAAEYGCTPAALYALLGKLRRRSGEGPRDNGPAQPPLALDPGRPADTAAPTFGQRGEAAQAEPGLAAGVAQAAAPSNESASIPAAATWDVPVAASPAAVDVNVLAFERSEPPAGAGVPPTQEAKPPATSAPPKSPAGTESLRQRSGRGALGAKLAKPGCGLVMRTADGEESMTPFRSVEDLLSAIKPILRASAASSDPVWFSLQPVDLATIDVDAA